MLSKIALFITACFVASAQAREVTLAWDADVDPVVGYRIHYGSVSGSYNQQLDVGLVLTAAVPNLADQTPYFFAATAFNADGIESLPSNEVLDAPSSYLVNENFEGTGTPTGWFNGSVNFDYTTIILGGRECVHSEANQYSFYNHGPQNEVWYHFKIRFVVFPNIGSNPFVIPFYLQSAAYGQLAQWAVFTDARSTLDNVTFTSTCALAPNTTHFVWAHYKKGPNGTWEVWWSTTDNRSTAPNHLQMAISNTAQVNQFVWLQSGIYGAVVLGDDFQAAITAIP